jgi:predicted AAA+ superfamily ATPase
MPVTRNVDFTTGYVRRVVDLELDELLPQLPAIWLDGPKAVGKTKTALERASTVRRLNRPAERAIAAADVELAIAGQQPVLIDEWQWVPAVWDAVTTAADNDSGGGQYLLTGSAPSGTHSGAGRIKGVRMRPLTLPERGVSEPTVRLRDLLDGAAPDVGGEAALTLADYTDEILRSGFPGMQHLTGRALRAQLDGYLDRVVDTDMEEAGLKVRRPATVRAWLRAYAASTATTTSWDRVRDAATAGLANKPAKTTVLPYIDVLTRLHILDELEAWIPGRNHLKRLTQRAKHHLTDPALAARLVGVTRGDLLAGRAGAVEIPRDGTYLGALFESMCALSVRVFAQAAEATVWHLRVEDGRHEIDLVVEREDGRVVALEAKLSGTVDDSDVTHLSWLRERIGDQLLDAAVLTTGDRAYRRADGIAVIPLALLGP